MRYLWIILVLLCPIMAAAQSQEEEDKSYIASLIEDSLSDVSREVNIIGFAGALSSQATMDALTVADQDGVWLTLEDVTLTWTRSALLLGAIDIDEISARRIVVARPPIAEQNAPSPEAQGFSLPELPVSISLGKLDIEEITLGEAFLGEPVAVSLQGAAELSGGQGSANVLATRLGEKRGIFEINGGYANDTRVLDLKLTLEEAADGIAARILDLPGRPAIGLQIEGNAPINDYAATLAIATDGADRLNGDFQLTDDGRERLIRLDVGGDVSPLFEEAYRPFFGDDAQLAVLARRTDDGRIDISNLDLRAQRLDLSGSMVIGAQGWPELIRLTGGVVRGDDPILLPLSGPQTFVDAVALDIDYNGAISDDWTADISVSALDRPGLYIEELSLIGGGLLRNGEGAQIGRVTAALDYGARGLRLDDAGASEALGDTISGQFRAERTEGEPTEITSLTLTGAGVELGGLATIQGPAAGLRTRANANLRVAGLERFSTLLGQELGGAATLALQADITPLDGLFDLMLSGGTTDLQLGIPQADAVLAGLGTITATAKRDENGTRLEAFEVRTSAAAVTAQADLTSGGSDASFTANLTNLDLVLPGLIGPANVAGDVETSAEGDVVFDLRGTGPSTRFSASGTAEPAENGRTINGALTASVTDLSRYAALAKRPLSGAATVDVTGVLLGDAQRFDADIVARTADLNSGISRLDPFLRGAGLVSAQVTRLGAERFRLSELRVETPALTATGQAETDMDGLAAADLDIRLPDAGVLDPSLNGPLSVALDVAPNDASDLDVDLTATGPGAEVALDAVLTRPDYAISGDMSASLANLAAYERLIGFPLSGGLDLSASGAVQPDLSNFDAKLALRTQNLSIDNPTADVLLRGAGRVNADMSLNDGRLAINTFEARTPQFTIAGALNGASGAGRGQFNASLRDIGVLTDQISGPVTARGTASLDERGNWGVNASGTGPGGLNAQVGGQVAQGGRLNLSLNGTIPLALANNAIEPRRLSGSANVALRVNGPPALSAINGRVTFTDGRLAAPTLAQALTDIGGQISIDGAEAQLDLSAKVEAGGGITVTGPVALEGANNADIRVDVRDVVLRDPELYSSSIAGNIRVRGPLQDGARIRGRLTLGQTDIRVPSSSVGTLGDLPTVQHVGQSIAVQQTLDRAGINVAPSTGNSRPSTRRPSNYPLDIVINAPSRIFVRGRGLDAELGGRVSISGTTQNIVPVGRFALLRGRIDILQQRFELTEGTATLQGDFEPYIRLVATTESSNGTTINIIVEGPAGTPDVRFESVPDLPQDEVLAQLIFGRDLDSISPFQAVQLASAISTLAGRGGGAVDRLRRNIGLDDFDVTTDDEGATALRAGKYLSDNVYTDVTVTSEGETEINLNLDITDEITAKGSVDQDGGTSIGIFFERDY